PIRDHATLAALCRISFSQLKAIKIKQKQSYHLLEQFTTFLRNHCPLLNSIHLEFVVSAKVDIESFQLNDFPHLPNLTHFGCVERYVWAHGGVLRLMQNLQLAAEHFPSLQSITTGINMFPASEFMQ